MKLAIVGSSAITDPAILQAALDGFHWVYPDFQITEVLICPGPGVAALARTWADNQNLAVVQIHASPDRFRSWAPHVQAVEMAKACDGLLIIVDGKSSTGSLRVWTDAGPAAHVRPGTPVHLYLYWQSEGGPMMPVEEYKQAQAAKARTVGYVDTPTGRRDLGGIPYKPAPGPDHEPDHGATANPLRDRVAVRYSRSAACCLNLQPNLRRMDLPHGHRWVCPMCGMSWLVVAENSPDPGIPAVRLWQVDHGQGRGPRADTVTDTADRGPDLMQDLRQLGPSHWRRLVAGRLGIPESEVTAKQISDARADWASIFQGFTCRPGSRGGGQ